MKFYVRLTPVLNVERLALPKESVADAVAVSDERYAVVPAGISADTPIVGGNYTGRSPRIVARRIRRWAGK